VACSVVSPCKVSFRLSNSFRRILHLDDEEFWRLPRLRDLSNEHAIIEKDFEMLRSKAPWNRMRRFCVFATSLSLSSLSLAISAENNADEESIESTEAPIYYASNVVEYVPDAAPDAVNDGEAEKKAAAAKKKKAEELKKKVATAYKDPFYLNDFSYLNDPNYKDCEIGEGLKGMPVGNCGKLDFGGQYRLRDHNEHNMRGLGLTGRDDNFLLDRTRFYFNDKMNDRIRVFSEFLDAGSSYENFAPRAIEVQHLDAQNLFVDALLIDDKAGKLSGRVGRQELLFGAQRLLSPLDWANTRRTFDGGRLTWSNDDRTTDFLLTQPLTLNVDRFDSPNQDQVLHGV